MLLKIQEFITKSPKLRRWVSRLLFNNREVRLSLFEAIIHINSLKENGYYSASNLSRLNSLFRDEIGVLLNLCGILSKGDTFVDIGANVGVFSAIISRFKSIYPDLEVHAFEANPDTFVRLQKTASEGNGFTVYPYAVSSSEKELEFAEGAVSHVFTEKQHMNFYHFKNQRFVKIQAKPLSAFPIKGDSLILKIDVEGQEWEVLQGALVFFEEKRVKAVYVDGYSDKRIPAFLAEYGFVFLDGRKLMPTMKPGFSLLALSQEHSTR